MSVESNSEDGIGREHQREVGRRPTDGRRTLSSVRADARRVAETCPFLEYRRAADGQSFDHERAYCSAAESFVQPMRADVCNGRHDLDHATDCEIFRDATGA